MAQLPRWRAADELARMVIFVVIPRPGPEAAVLPAPFRGCQLGGYRIGISSSQIRARLRAGRPTDFLVPPAVAAELNHNSVYWETQVRQH